jgi:hypothetical protein
VQIPPESPCICIYVCAMYIVCMYVRRYVCMYVCVYYVLCMCVAIAIARKRWNSALCRPFLSCVTSALMSVDIHSVLWSDLFRRTLAQPSPAAAHTTNRYSTYHSTSACICGGHAVAMAIGPVSSVETGYCMPGGVVSQTGQHMTKSLICELFALLECDEA